MGDLREKMRQDLVLRGYRPQTIQAYIGHVKKYVKYYMISPDKLDLEDVLRFMLYLIEVRKLEPRSVNANIAAIKFFYTISLKRKWPENSIPWVKVRKKQPEILSPEQIAQVLNATKNIKYRTIFAVMYSAGLRPNEVLHLKAQDILSPRMLIHVKSGKGGNERYTLLSEKLLNILRDYWIKNKKEDKSCWMFPGQNKINILHGSNVRKMFKEIQLKIGLTKPCKLHSLRHAFATHLLESGIDLRVIQILLGHVLLSSTIHYTRLRKYEIPQMKNPLDFISSQLKF